MSYAASGRIQARGGGAPDETGGRGAGGVRGRWVVVWGRGGEGESGRVGYWRPGLGRMGGKEQSKVVRGVR